jgi:predicted aspartyl protease
MRRLRILALTIATLSTPILGIAPSAAAGECRLAKIAEWPVRIERNKIIVDGAINGQRIGVMLDTGAERSLILGSAVARLGLTMQRTGGRIIGIGGESDAAAVRIEEFRIGDAARRDWLVVVAAERGFGPGVGFILGEDFFSQVDVEFDLAHNRVRLFVPKDCGDVALAYWAADGVNVVPLVADGIGRYRILLTVKVNGQPVDAMLDSGASGSVLNRADATRLGLAPQSAGVVPVGTAGGLGRQTIDIWRVPVSRVSIGDETIRDTSIDVADLWKGTAHVEIGSHVPVPMLALPGMLLGADFLLSHRVLVSHSQHRMYFTYAGGAVFSGGAAIRVSPSEDENDGAEDPGARPRDGAVNPAIRPEEAK